MRNEREYWRRAKMIAEGLEKIVARHERECLELKESFNVECIKTACAFFIDKK